MFWLEQLGMLVVSVCNFTQRLFYIRSYRNNRDAHCALQWRGGCSPKVKLEVESSWNLMAPGDAREGKWRGNRRMELVASTLTLRQNTVCLALLPLMCTPRLPVVDWTDAPADLNGLVLFAERPNLVSARVPSHFKCSLTQRCGTYLARQWSV